LAETLSSTISKFFSQTPARIAFASAAFGDRPGNIRAVSMPGAPWFAAVGVVAACSGSGAPSAVTPAPVASAEPVAIASDAAPAPADAYATATEAPNPLELATAVFDGRVLATGSGSDAFCVTIFYDQTESAQSTWLDLVDCSYAEDEVGIYYLDRGEPTRDQAIGEFADRIGTCLDNPTLLEVVTWPTSGAELEVADWNARFRFKARTLTIAAGGSLRAVTFEPGHRPQSVHRAADGSFFVVRTAGVVNGHPASKCATVEI
jgi:hypothetical protein